MPSPTVPSRRRLERSHLSTQWSPHLMKRANGCRGGVKNGDAVFFDESPKAAFVGPVGRAFVHEHRGAGGQRAVNDVTVAGDPAAIGRAPEHVVVAVIEDPLERFFDEQIVAGGGVLDALGFAGASRWCRG